MDMGVLWGVVVEGLVKLVNFRVMGEVGTTWKLDKSMPLVLAILVVFNSTFKQYTLNNAVIFITSGK